MAGFGEGMKYIAKHFVNPWMRKIAGHSLSPISLVRHVGRRSGKSYETP